MKLKIDIITTPKVALTLKKLGFNERCDHAYAIDGDSEPKLASMFDDWCNKPMNNIELTQYCADLCFNNARDCTAPTYIQVWEWLWKVKRIRLTPKESSEDPIGDIINAINYLVENDSL